MFTTVCLIVKNEERCLERCLASVAAAADALVVVDTGSTDRTREIALSFRATVIDLPWQGSFAQAKNEALRHAAGDWVFFLDADEYYPTGGAAALRGYLETLPAAVDAVELRRYELLGAGMPNEYTPVIRAFRGGRGIGYRGAIHEYLTKDTSGGSEPLMTVAVPTEAIYLLHDGYAGRRNADKAARNVAILTRLIETGEGDADPLLHFYLAESLWPSGDYPEMWQSYQRYLTADRTCAPICLCALLKAEEALRLSVSQDAEAAAWLSGEAERRYPSHPAALVLCGNVAYADGRAAALAFYEQAVAGSADFPDFGYSLLKRVRDWPLVLTRLGLLREQGGDSLGGREAYLRALRLEPRDETALRHYLRGIRHESSEADIFPGSSVQEMAKLSHESGDSQLYLQTARAEGTALPFLVFYDEYAGKNPGLWDEYYTTMQVIMGEYRQTIRPIGQLVTRHPLWRGDADNWGAEVGGRDRARVEAMLSEALAGCLLAGDAEALVELRCYCPRVWRDAITLCLGGEAEPVPGGEHLLDLVSGRLSAHAAPEGVLLMWQEVRNCWRP
jgi:tetratricopeptide (TPR) repeat protein